MALYEATVAKKKEISLKQEEVSGKKDESHFGEPIVAKKKEISLKQEGVGSKN